MPEDASTGPGGDGIAASDMPVAADASETSEADARLIRSVRWRLVAWSGGTTLLVLIVLAIALYASVADSLASTGVAQLDHRANDFQRYIETGPRPAPAGGRPTSGSGGAGTFALAPSDPGRPASLAPRATSSVPAGLPDAKSIDGAKQADRDLRTTTIAFTAPTGTTQVPVRVLTIKATNPSAGTFFVQVVQDRTTEVQTLQRPARWCSWAAAS